MMQTGIKMGLVIAAVWGVALTMTIPTSVEAATCARGVYRAGCAGPRGAVVTRSPAVVAPRAVGRCALVNGVRVCR